MDKPRSWQMLQAWQQLLQQITQANGYYTDAGTNVVLEPAQVPDEATEILLAPIMDSVQRPQAGPTTGPRGVRAASVAIIAKVYSGIDENHAQELLHSVFDDIDQLVERHRGVQGTFPAQVTYPQFASFQAIPAADGMNWVGAEIRFNASYIPLAR